MYFFLGENNKLSIPHLSFAVVPKLQGAGNKTKGFQIAAFHIHLL